MNPNLKPGPVPGGCLPLKLTSLRCPCCRREALEARSVEYATHPHGGCENLASLRVFCGSCWEWAGLLVIHNHRGMLQFGLVTEPDDRRVD